ncbi:uncharacterized protein V6R79_005914 [Siganus canaliculatus]
MNPVSAQFLTKKKEKQKLLLCTEGDTDVLQNFRIKTYEEDACFHFERMQSLDEDEDEEAEPQQIQAAGLQLQRK